MASILFFSIAPQRGFAASYSDHIFGEWHREIRERIRGEPEQRGERPSSEGD
jgi:hypothetical protein